MSSSRDSGFVFLTKMLAWFFFLGNALSVPTGELFGGLLKSENPSVGSFLMPIVPSGNPSNQKFQNLAKTGLSDIVDEENEYYKQFMMYMEKGHTMKGLTFNLYDDNMRGAAVSFFRLLGDLKDDSKVFYKIREWAKQNMNDDMFEYAWRLVRVHNQKFDDEILQPIFISKPHFFVNAETIRKALNIKISNRNFNPQDAKVNQYYRNNDIIVINTNYSGWNIDQNKCGEKIDYFLEDIALNSFYYSINLLYPFWMNNTEMDQKYSRPTEQFYFYHQQLMARYLLEKEHLKQRNISTNEQCESYYNPSLVYKNGLMFPTRLSLNRGWESDDTVTKFITIVTSIRECIARGVIFMENGTITNLTEDNYVDLITRLIRANLDGAKTAKYIRSIYAYGPNGYPIDKYNPAPSVLHHPETSLRDPIFWNMIENMLNIYAEYRKTLTPYDLSEYETNEFNIINSNLTKITTYFYYYQFNINKAAYNNMSSSFMITARQRRLGNLPFMFNFTVEAKNNSKVTVRLFLGPQCSGDTCWENHSKFFELDAFYFLLNNGSNVISWSPNKSTRFTSDESFNYEFFPSDERYCIFTFPKNLLVPKGLKEGLEMTLFVMITSAEDDPNFSLDSGFFEECEEMPLGFPFHRQAVGSSDTANNYKFYNISIYHKTQSVDKSGYFSPHLY